MRETSCFFRGVRIVVRCWPVLTVFLAGCATGGSRSSSGPVIRPQAEGLKELKAEGSVLLRLKADPARAERVSYFHRSNSKSFEENEVRHQKEETLEFTSQAETVKVEPADENGLERFTQVITVVSKDGNANLHDFAMPETGEKLEITANGVGEIIKSGDYPSNSIFYVPPISLPKEPVAVGDTWTLKASWLSLEEMIPYQLDMVSILKGLWSCGKNKCAEIEISGDVGFQGPLAQTMTFESHWNGRIFFDIDAGTVVWSRVDSDERFLAENVRREVSSCLEAALIEPEGVKLPGIAKPSCEPRPATTEVEASP